jgi:hypothetical protein
MIASHEGRLRIQRRIEMESEGRDCGEDLECGQEWKNPQE